MRNDSVHCIFFALVIFLPVLVEAQETSIKASSQSAPFTPKLSGIWRASTLGYSFRPKEPFALQPWAQEKYRRVREGMDANEKGRDDLDPTIVQCAPIGVPRLVTYARYPFEIIELPGRVIILYEADYSVRQIWTDGRKFPEVSDLTWLGYSIGKWEGDTLVVETVGLTDRTWLDNDGLPHSDALRVVERYRRSDANTLVIDYLFDDPKAYTKPWTTQRVFQSRPDWEIHERLLCEDRLLEEIDKAH